MSKAPTQGEIEYNDKCTWVLISLDKKQLAALRLYAEHVNKSLPGLARELVLDGIGYDDSIDS